VVRPFTRSTPRAADVPVPSLVFWEPRHLRGLGALYRECFPGERWTVRDLERVGLGQSTVLKCLLLDGAVVGSILTGVTPEFCRIRRVAVTERLRRQGLGRFLVTSQMVLPGRLYAARVHSRNTAAQLFFSDGLGFAFDPHAEREADTAGEDYYLFTKRL